MQPASDLDGVDFKPFFDMVVGILFVLLILIGALLFFQRTDQHAVERAKQQAEWLTQRSDFLNTLAKDLRDRGLPATVDLPNVAVVVPLTLFADLRADGLPNVRLDPLKTFGSVLGKDLPCIVGPMRDTSDACAKRPMLRLNALPVQLRVAGISSMRLPPDRFSQLLAMLIQGGLMTASPDLMKLSAPSGDILMHVSGAVAATTATLPSGLAGDAVLGFDFAPP